MENKADLAVLSEPLQAG